MMASGWLLMIASLASLLEDPILYEALRSFERPSDLDGVRPGHHHRALLEEPVAQARHAVRRPDT